MWTLLPLAKLDPKSAVGLNCSTNAGCWNSLAKAENVYGQSFEIVDCDLENGFVSEESVCGYRTFQARHNTLQLNETPSEWNKVWIEAHLRSVDFRGPTTLATDSSSRKFEIQQRRSRRFTLPNLV